MSASSVFGAIFCVSTAVGCSFYDPALPSTPFFCATTEPRCPDGFTCANDAGGKMVCVAASTMLVDAAVAHVDCADDSLLETQSGSNNNSKDTAYRTPIAGHARELTLTGLAICPEGDRDTYLVKIITPVSLEAISSWQSGQAISVDILNSAGTSISTGAPVGNTGARAYMSNLSAGTYFVQTSAGGKNNYALTLRVTTP